MQDTALVFTGGEIWDGEHERRYRGEVRVEGERIRAVTEGWGTAPRDGARIVDCSGATLMPGLIDAHGHLPFPAVQTYFTQLEDTPIEELVLATVHNAKLMLDQGFTGIIGAGSPRLRVELAVRNEIDAGRLPGPRILASSPTLTTTGGLNDTAQLHQGRSPCAMVLDGPIEARRAVRTSYREGVDVIKVNISGDDIIKRPPGRMHTMAEDEVAAIAQAARPLGLKLIAHARATESIKSALRNGFDIVHHADFCDSEAFDMFEARKNHVFVTASLGFLHNLRYEAEAFGFTRAALDSMGVDAHFEANIASHRELHRRGVRGVIGGDYGLPWQPHGTNARDIEHLIKYLGFTAVEALRSATQYGAQAMGRGHELGLIKAGYLADLIVVDGDPTTNVSLLQQAAHLRAIVKNGVPHKAP